MAVVGDYVSGAQLRGMNPVSDAFIKAPYDIVTQMALNKRSRYSALWVGTGPFMSKQHVLSCP